MAKESFINIIYYLKLIIKEKPPQDHRPWVALRAMRPPFGRINSKFIRYERRYKLIENIPLPGRVMSILLRVP